jgi:hypothetical protein
LVGYPALLVPVVVQAQIGTLPADSDFRGAAKMGLEQANNGYREILSDAASGKELA